MYTIEELNNYLSDNHCDFEIIEHEKPIIATQDAEKYFDISKCAPTFVIQTENGLVALIVSSQRGRLDLKEIKESLGFSKFKFADKDKILNTTGYTVGSIPFIGHNLPCILDRRLLNFDYIYGGSGDELHTLKIRSGDVERLSNVIKYIE